MGTHTCSLRDPRSMGFHRREREGSVAVVRGEKVLLVQTQTALLTW